MRKASHFSRPDENDVRKIERIANLYEQNLCRRDVLFCCGTKDSEFSSLPVRFEGKHFAHLVGIKPIFSRVSSATELYRRLLNHDVVPSDIKFTHSRKIFDIKLEVAEITMAIDSHARVLGEFDEMSFVNTRSDQIASAQNANVGFILDDDFYIPNTVLNRDYRSVMCSGSISDICATFKRSMDSPEKTLGLSYLNPELSSDEKEKLVSYVELVGFGEAGSVRTLLLPDVEKSSLPRDNSREGKGFSLESVSARASDASKNGQVLGDNGYNKSVSKDEL